MRVKAPYVLPRQLFSAVLVLALMNSAKLVAQPTNLFATDNALIHINEGALVTLDGSADVAGRIQNEGLIKLTGNVDFYNNRLGGDLELLGENVQVLGGKRLYLDNLTIANEAGVNLVMDSLFVNESLNLVLGELNTTSSYLMLSSGNMNTGSEDAYITGRFYQKSAGESLYFPLGLNGYFNPLQLTPLPTSSIVGVELKEPEENRVLQQDSLVGLAREVEWLVSYEGSRATTEVDITFNGLDLLSASNQNPIRAFSYSPVIAARPSGQEEFVPLGVAELLDTDSLTFGSISSSKSVTLLDGATVPLTIGRMPISDGLQFYMPNVLTPNGGMEENRRFRPFLVGTPITNIRMVIWDTFNREVYNINEEDPMLEELGWDGYSNSSVAAQGTYFYSVMLTTDSGMFEQSGSFILLP